MGRIWMPGGGGGADLDAVTAGANDVVAPKVIVGPDGEPISGNLVDQPLGVAASGFRNGGSNVFFVDFPKGAYRQESSVGLPSINVTAEQIRNAGGLTAAKLAQGQSAFGLTGTYKGLGNAAAADVRSGKTFSTAALSNAAGTMPEQGGSTTTPGTVAKTIVAANRYVTGNIVVAGDRNLVAANIKKNVTIFGVKGTCEGWFPTATDLYLRGNNPAGFAASGIQSRNPYTFQSGAIYVAGSYGYAIKYLLSASSYNLSSYTYVNFEFNNIAGDSTRFRVLDAEENILASAETTGTGSKTLSLDISSVNKTTRVGVYVHSDEMASNTNAVQVYRIWLS